MARQDETRALDGQDESSALDLYADPAQHGERPPDGTPVEMLVDAGAVASQPNMERAEADLRNRRPSWFERGRDVAVRGAPVIGIAAIVGAAGVIAAFKAYRRHRRRSRGEPSPEPPAA